LIFLSMTASSVTSSEAAVDPGDQPAAVVVGGDGQYPAGESHQGVVFDAGVLVAGGGTAARR
jgi:hypothetical protein